ncbi:hypothetical protein [Streptomyces sp. YS415]|uniref:hypothetical protein n=1 Tax=Streptomyces sp. YS415 TaxID=2944806 RepID=UPI0020224205|nr:hypothetical protein [Streptomyces sp. YS415]MCL7430361.1 hypothetical protein [Streptomyces sp. YS415]
MAKTITGELQLEGDRLTFQGIWPGEGGDYQYNLRLQLRDYRGDLREVRDVTVTTHDHLHGFQELSGTIGRNAVELVSDDGTTKITAALAYPLEGEHKVSGKGEWMMRQAF